MNTVALMVIILLNSVTIIASFHTVVWTNCAAWYRNRGDRSNAPIPWYVRYDRWLDRAVLRRRSR